MRIFGAFSILRETPPVDVAPGAAVRPLHCCPATGPSGAPSGIALLGLLAHSDIKTTERYVHAASVQDIAAALDKMDRV